MDICFVNHQGKLVHKYFKTESELQRTLLNEAQKIEAVRRTTPNITKSENEELLKREKYLVDLMDKYASPSTKRERERCEEEKAFMERDKKRFLKRRKNETDSRTV